MRSFLLFSLLFLAACSKTPSSSVPTQDLDVSLAMTVNEDQSISCDANFRIKDVYDQSIELDNGDEIFCNEQPMGKEEFLGRVDYRKTHLKKSDAYSIRFHRPKDGNFVTYFTFPKPIQLKTNSFFNLKKGVDHPVSYVASVDPSDILRLQFSFSGKSFSRSASTYQYGETGTITMPAENTAGTELGVWSGNARIVRYQNMKMPSGLRGNAVAEQELIRPLSLVD